MKTNDLTAKLNLLNSKVLEAFNLSTEQDIIAEFIKTGIKVLGADFGYCFIKAPNNNKFSLAYITPGVDYKPITKPRKQGIVARAFKTRKPQLISDVPQADFVRYDAKSAMHSVAVIPITYKKNSYGTLHFAYYNRHEFNENEMSLYSHIGNSAAQAITINRLYNNLKDFKNTLDNTLDSLFIFDPKTFKLIYVNQGAAQLIGLKRSEMLRKTLPEIIIGLTSKELQEKVEAITNNEDVAHAMIESVIRPTGKPKVPVEISLQRINKGGQSAYLLAVMRDITERKQSEKSITRMAYYDQLTGLPNRALLTERLIEEHARAEAGKSMYAVFFMDLDRFKIINDIYGHQVGDQLLKQIAQRLQKALPKKATISRMGGDEFLVLLPKIQSVNEAEKCATSIQEIFTEFFVIGEHELYCNGSIGFAVYPLDGADYHVVMKHADLALYRAKDHGGNNIQQYRIGQPLFYTIQPKLQSQLKKAIQKNELVLHYQPVINVKTKRITGCEALIRWNHPEMGLLYPGDFIGQSEESGLIVEIGEWVIKETCLQIREWEKYGRIPPPVSINVSPRELLRPSLVNYIEQTLKDHKISPSQIKVELTETFLMKDIDLSIGILQQLKALGLRILIDDFGTGYASLNYLRRLPIDAVKVDRSFVSGVPKSLQDAALTSAIIAISHQLGLEVVAEGVENLDQFEFLRAAQCNYAQGNFFFKPVTGEQFADLLHLTNPI